MQTGNTTLTPRTEPTMGWEPCTAPNNPTDTLKSWEYTSPLGWTHVVTVTAEPWDCRTPPYTVAWETPDYRGTEYRTVDGDLSLGPHVTRDDTALKAMTRDGAYALARSFRDEIITAPGAAHENVPGIVDCVDSENADRTTVIEYLKAWDTAEAMQERRDAEWREERREIHENARDEYATVCEYRTEILSELENNDNTGNYVPTPKISDSDAYTELIEKYVSGEILIHEFERRVTELLD